MNEIERALLDALNELETTVAAGRSGLVPSDLGAVLQRIDTLSEQLPGPADPVLRHYLQRKSYEKARLHLVETERTGRGGDPVQT